MKCFSFIDNQVVEGIPNIYDSTLKQATITEASVRFYVCEQNATLLSEAAKKRYEDLFLYGYTELIPENGSGNLFPEGSYLLDIAIADYISEQSQQCMKIQTIEDRVLLGCIKESIITTPYGIISWSEDGLALQDGVIMEKDLSIPKDVLVLEL